MFYREPTKMTDKIGALATKAFIEALDSRVYQMPTNLIRPSESVIGGIAGGLTGEIIGSYSFPNINLSKTSDLIKSDPELKQVKSLKSDMKIPRVPSKYARTYELEKFKGNRMIIFNHNVFHDSSERPGTRLDEAALINTFTKFSFEVQSHNDLSRRKLMDTLKNFAAADFSEYGCVCVAVLTHGTDKPGYLEAHDQHYSEHEIFEPFDCSKNPTLAAKPIIFIIQACRGAKPAMKVSSRYQLDLDDESAPYHLPTEADRIVFHSSAVGRASVRHPHRGSWFIQSLCNKIQEHAYKDDLETIFRLVRREVALDFVNSRDWKQMPVVTSTLLRELYLVPSNPKETQDYSCTHTEAMELPEKPKEPWPKTPDECPDSSLTQVQPIHMPCSCFLEYFEYLKKCLEGFVQHNPEDTVAKNLLKMTQRVGDGAEYNVQKFSFIQSVWEHFEANMDKFPPHSLKFLYRQYI
ncbi:caspase-1-like [Choristoneura fumiferana]|uniref:caspase-1-like n=1 Tax=Choristoneura fumiferana TaxID=7141 RepID=UPI003D15E74F